MTTKSSQNLKISKNRNNNDKQKQSLHYITLLYMPWYNVVSLVCECGWRHTFSLVADKFCGKRSVCVRKWGSRRDHCEDFSQAPSSRSTWFVPHDFRGVCACPLCVTGVFFPLTGCCHPAIMLSHSRCFTRNFGRSLSAIRQVGNKQVKRCSCH